MVDNGARVLFQVASGTWTELFPFAREEMVAIKHVTSQEWLGFVVAAKSATRVLMFASRQNQAPALCLEIQPPQGTVPRIRLDGSALTLADSDGRVRVYDLTYGALIRAFNLTE
jgi:hypothetical protein